MERGPATERGNELSRSGDVLEAAQSTSEARIAWCRAAARPQPFARKSLAKSSASTAVPADVAGPLLEEEMAVSLELEECHRDAHDGRWSSIEGRHRADLPVTAKPA